ncbi:hypothetical protein HD553DRAFT_304932 [Filobasidium floriforme]|uniref:uncharacterized protein n=1 Tax=Filobasidium floriforme TaxID=5210 RepID=UPI001E8E904B|nr:uncharacterized protein HD553DRAFT_304932 [Filobasidium floriforme]KAH8089012.1 hypothetical protein HD553DRAFT_304932 [Filobasidium floriforme]
MTKGAHTRSNFEIFDRTLTMVSVALVCVWRVIVPFLKLAVKPKCAPLPQGISYITHLASFASLSLSGVPSFFLNSLTCRILLRLDAAPIVVSTLVA